MLILSGQEMRWASSQLYLCICETRAIHVVWDAYYCLLFVYLFSVLRFVNISLNISLSLF